MIHICTNETFMTGSIPLKGYCQVCCKDNQNLKLGWIETKCEGCGNYFSIEDLQETVRKRRELLVLSRKEIGEKLGLSAKTISNYENVWPSKKYWLATEKLMEGFK